MKQPSRLRNAWLFLPFTGVLFFLSYSAAFASIQVVATSSFLYGNYCTGYIDQALAVGTAANRIAFVTLIDSNHHSDVVDVKYHSQNFTLLNTENAGSYSYDFYYLLNPITTGFGDDVHVDFIGSGGGCSNLKLDAISYSGVAQVAPAYYSYPGVGNGTENFAATSSDVSLLMALEYGGGSPSISSPTYSLENRYEASVSTFDFGNGTSSLSNGTNSFTHTSGSTDWIYQAVFEPATLSLSSRQQYHTDVTSPIGEGDTTAENQVVFGAQLHSNATSSLQLQVEVRSAGSNNFTGTANATSVSVSPEGNATATFPGSNGSYHWQARVWDATNSTSSGWYVFGPSVSTSTDFTISYAPPTSIELVATSSLLYSHYCGPFQEQPLTVGTSSDRIAFVTLIDSNSHTDVVSVRYHSQDFTLLNTETAGSYSYDFYYLLDPTMTGSDDSVRVNFGNGTSCSNLKFDAISYSGVAQVAPTYYSYADVGNGTETFSTTAGDTSLVMALEYGGYSPTITSPTYNLRNRYEASVSTFDYGNDGSALGNGTSSFTHTIGSSNDWIYQAVFAPASGMQESYYGQIENSTRNLHAASSTSSSVLKTLPADWAIYIESSTDSSGDPIVNGSDTWYKVMDPTDGVTGWMVASDTTTTYISSYDGSMQADLEASSSLGYVANKTQRIQTLIGALDHYYTNSDSSSSLYSSDDHVNISDEFNSSSPSTTFPESLVLGIAATESGASSTTQGTDNGIVGADVAHSEYGHGIMQLTVSYQGEDIKYLQRILNSDPDTVVNSSTGADGSMGHETHDFGNLTENAVERFQTKYSLTDPAGVVATSTLAELNSILSGSPTSSITSLIPSDWRFNLEQDRPYQQLGTEDYASSTPSIDIRYKDPGGFDNRTAGNDIDIPPCDNFTDPATSTFFENCYLNTSPINGYATSTAYGQEFQYYADTAQSIYANVKGALTLLRENYVATTTPVDYFDGVTTTTFTGAERSWLRDIWHYNGAFLSTTYLTAVANQMTDFHAYRVGATQLVATTTETADLVNKLEIADDNKTQIIVFSPVEPEIIDSEGRVVGSVGGKVTEDIPDSAYNPITKSAVVFLTNDQYSYQVVGTEPGDYGIEIITTKNGKATVFSDSNIPIQTGVIHKYTLDLAALARGEKGVTRTIEDADSKISKVEKLAAATTTIQALEAADPINSRVLPTINYPQPVQRVSVPVVVHPSMQISIPSSTPTSSFEISTTTVASTTLRINASTTLEIDTSTIELATSTENNSSTQNQ